MIFLTGRANRYRMPDFEDYALYGSRCPEGGRLVERDSQGNVVVWVFESLSESQRMTQKNLRSIIESIFSDDQEAAFDRFSRSGLDHVFLNAVARSLGPDSPAFVFYIPRDLLVDTPRLLDTLPMFNGNLYHASFPDKVEVGIEALRKIIAPVSKSEQLRGYYR